MWITIDPGFHTGWALFRESGRKRVTFIPTMFHECGVLHADKDTKIPFPMRVAAIMKGLASLQDSFDINMMIIESQQVYRGSAQSMASATSGDLIELAQLTGAIWWLFAQTGTATHIFTPQQWKGQLPKNVVEMRVAKHFPDTYFPNHALDAVGMGISFMNGMKI
jgi:Holliday junction resolvasome RuvABC endonuclease subunit